MRKLVHAMRLIVPCVLFSFSVVRMIPAIIGSYHLLACGCTERLLNEYLEVVS